MFDIVKKRPSNGKKSETNYLSFCSGYGELTGLPDCGFATKSTKRTKAIANCNCFKPQLWISYSASVQHYHYGMPLQYQRLQYQSIPLGSTWQLAHGQGLYLFSWPYGGGCFHYWNRYTQRRRLKKLCILLEIYGYRFACQCRYFKMGMEQRCFGL